MIDLQLEELWLDVKDGQEITGTLRLSFTLGKRWLSINAVRDEKLLAQQRHFYEKFHLRNTLRLTADDDVGVVVVKIIRAENISHSTATNRNTGIFCSVQLTNSRLDTFISESSADPEWNCVFTFPVKDIHTELFISLWHHSGSDPAGKAIFYGGTALRLTEIINKQPCWLPLKDKELQADVPGLILLEMEAIYNPVRAAVKSIARKESYPSRKEAKISLKVRLTVPVQSINQSIKNAFVMQSINQSINQSIDFYSSQSINQSINRWMRLYIDPIMFLRTVD